MKRAVLFAALTCAAQETAPPLRPFAMPWNDASPGITNLQSWQSVIGVDSSRLLVNRANGHYERDGERVRILGVNITAANAFPESHETADAHAARLARFGFNGVRFHHLEAPWDKQRVLVDYGKGSSRELSAERLDRLHYFVSALAARGIATDMNLIVSREFQRGDGLGDEITQMGWKDQHVLGFFHEGALALHKEYAAKLLTAPNPYREGVPLAADPAVAIVEIMNENGLLQKWHETVLDNMPLVYRNALQDRWNAWLAAKYESTGAMLASWGALNDPLGASMLRNGDFANGSASWNVERHNGAVANVTFPAGFTNGAPSIRIEVATPGDADWHVQLNQAGLRLVAGQAYTVSFWAKAETANTPLAAAISRAYGDFGTISGGPRAVLGTAWREYSWILQYSGSAEETNARLNFNGFGNLRATVSIAGVRVQPGGKIGGIPDGRSLESRNVPNVAKVSASLAPTAAQLLDWVRFVRDAEAAYWTEMRRYIKEDLGFGGIVFATIVSNSSPNAQVSQDAMDSHFYWQHPAFLPGRDFDPVEWTVTNLSMLTDPNSGGIGAIARQRVQGMPHNVTEYQHPAPNTFSSESPILAAAYGALQDWDSIWFFEYGTSTAEYATGFFDQSGHAGKMVNNLIAAMLFRRGDVSPATNEFAFAFTPEIEANLAATRGGAWNIADGAHLGIPASLALVSRVSLALSGDSSGRSEIPPAPVDRALVSDSGQLTWDRTSPAKGIFTAKTPRSKVLMGFASAGVTYDLGDGVMVVPGVTRQGWAAISVSIAEGEAFASGGGGAKKILITATGDQENTGMTWKNPASRNSVGDKWGGAPVLVEAPRAEITLPIAAARVKAWVLDGKGQRLQELAVEAANEGASALIRIGNPDLPASLWYEIEVASEN